MLTHAGPVTSGHILFKSGGQIVLAAKAGPVAGAIAGAGAAGKAMAAAAAAAAAAACSATVAGSWASPAVVQAVLITVAVLELAVHLSRVPWMASQVAHGAWPHFVWPLFDCSPLPHPSDSWFPSAPATLG